MNEITLPPFAPTLIESIRAIGYSLESAISDVLDNSISADVTEVEISFTPYDEPYIAIFDNGCGMDGDNAPDTLMITASNKMRTAQNFEQLVSTSGRLVESSWLSKKSNNSNLVMTESFLDEIQLFKNSVTEHYEGVDHEIITDLLREFVTHSSYLPFDGRQIATYIEENRLALKPWTVCIASGSMMYK